VPKKPVRPIRVEGDVAYVPLTQGYEAIIDAEDVPLVEGYNWCILGGSRVSKYAQRRAKNLIPAILLMHRVIMGVNGPELHIDHINGNGLDNRKSNLRVVSRSQNMWNSRKPCTNSSGYKGVCMDKEKGKWVSHIKKHNKQMHLGYFNTPEEAYEAYCKAAKELHGDFHNLG
jgi:hypothetical protein